MFGPFASVERKMRRHAANWLELASKVYHFRRDVLKESERAELLKRSESVRQQLTARADASRLKLEIDGLEDVLRRTGGTFYPKSSLVEYVEFFVVAAIVILGIRAFFVQPFKIPTNSMWPSYHGMTGEVFATPAEEPGWIAKGFRFATQLANPHRYDAPVDGEIGIPVAVFDGGRTMVPFRTVPGRKWGFIPTRLREYEIAVGRTPVIVQVPGDFDFDRVLLDAYFHGRSSFPVSQARSPGQTVLLRTGRHVRAGERILAFDILTGDQLFVDRLSYHFVPPRVGQGFVFRTGNIRGLAGDQYYIKRLVGVPGDTLEIREPELWRNGGPITGVAAFDRNNRQEGAYAGYVAGPATGTYAMLRPGESVTLPEASYFALGDNSNNSADSRYWGFVPAADAVGRPLVIYYPFTRRWGVAP
jgi:signal peptidase I